MGDMRGKCSSTKIKSLRRSHDTVSTQYTVDKEKKVNGNPKKAKLNENNINNFVKVQTFSILSCLLPAEILKQLCLNQKNTFFLIVKRGDNGPCFDVQTPHDFGVQLQVATNPECSGLLILMGEGGLFKATVETKRFHFNQKCFHNNSSLIAHRR